MEEGCTRQGLALEQMHMFIFLMNKVGMKKIDLISTIFTGKNANSNTGLPCWDAVEI